MAETKKKKKGGIGSVISTIILIAALAVFCYAAYNLITIYLAYKVGTDEYSALETYAETEKTTEGFVEEQMAENETIAPGEWGEAHVQKSTLPLETMENPIDFASLLEINEDIIGWLEIGALGISYPIVQGEDNDYYLHRTFRRQDNFSGSIFLDYENSSDFSQRNSIVYGHNMKNGSMFGILSRFRSQETVDSDPYFWIYTPTKIYKYQIFSTAEVGKYSDNYQIDFANAKDWQDFLSMISSQNLIKSDASVGETDTIVTLSTCTGNDATRFIVQGVRVRTFTSVEKAGGYETEE